MHHCGPGHRAGRLPWLTKIHLARRHASVHWSLGHVAQGIERLRPKEGAGGSSPSVAAKIFGLAFYGLPLSVSVFGVVSQLF